MKIITNGNIEIKDIAKNLKKELKNFDIELSHSASLNTVSRILGFTNYNTYKAIFDNKNKSISPTQKFVSIKEKLLLFERIPYEIRYIENICLSVEQVEKAVTEYLHYHDELIFANIAKVFTDNKNNPYNLVLELRNCKIPKNSYWIEISPDIGIELISNEYISTRREVDSIIVEDMLKYNEDLELLEAFKVMVCVNDGEILQSLNEEVFKFNNPNSEYYEYRNLLITRQKDVSEIARMYNLDIRPLYNSFK